jgi:hypothetical protein
MHTAALIGERIYESNYFGWKLDKKSAEHSWVVMRENIQSHVKQLNFGHRGQLRDVGIDYLNKLGENMTYDV